MKTTIKGFVLVLLGLVGLIGPAEAQMTGTFRCDDGRRPFMITIERAGPDSIRISNFGGATRTLRVTIREPGLLVYTGGRGNEYNVSFVRGQTAFGMNMPNVENVSCLPTRAAAPRPAPPLSSCPPGTVPVPETDNCVPARRAPQAGGPAFCAQPRNAAEETICGDRLLRDSERTLQTAYRRAVFDSRGQRAEIDHEQRRWLGRRNLCGANTTCILQRNEEQLTFLETFFGN
jgi:uncharacterized protein YecT (DUF1311 family)